MSIIEKAVGFLTTIFVVVVAVLLTPVLFGVRPYIVMSGSMNPAVRTGSLAYVYARSSEPDSFVPGDIIAYKSGDNTVTHRVIKTTEDGYKTKGDANASEDEGIVHYSDVVGKLLYSIPYVGYAVNMVKKPFIGIILAVLVGAYCVFAVLSDKKTSNGGKHYAKES